MILPLLPFYAQELHASPFEIGLLFSSYSLAQLLFAPLLGRLSDRVGRRPVLLASIAGGAASYLLFALAPTYGVLLLARTLSGLAAADRKSTRLNSSHSQISYAVFCLKKKNTITH